MNAKLITTASNIQHEGWLQFRRSLDHFNWQSICLQHEWRGFGGKILETYNYLKNTEEGRGIDLFFYSDSYDSFCLGTPDEAMEKVKKNLNFWQMTFSTEKACYPHGEWAHHFPDPGHQWRFLNGEDNNGGGWYGMRTAFLRMVENDMPPYDINDQVWFQEQYINHNLRKEITLEKNCEIFQTIGFEHHDDFAYRKGRLINLETLTIPIFIHGNGKTSMEKIYKLIA